MNEEFEKLRRSHPAVCGFLKAGGTLEDCVVALAAQNERWFNRIVLLESICPRRIRLADGTEMIWRCPTELVPMLDGGT
jgi:hypothetical protein